MVLKTRGLGTGTIFVCGSYVAAPRLLAWLHERTVLVKSKHELHHLGEYTENIYKVHNDNVRNAVRTHGTCAVAQQHPCRIHKPVLGTHYSGTVPCRTTCTNHDITVQLHIDDTILCIINDIMIVLY